MCTTGNLHTIPQLSQILQLDESSKQQLANIGLPSGVASLFIEKFGRNASLVAKWFKEYVLFGRAAEQGWFYNQRVTSFGHQSSDDLTIYSKLYDAAMTRDDSVYKQTKESIGLYVDPAESSIDFDRYIPALKTGLDKALQDSTFFRQKLVKDLTTKKLTDLKPYSKMTFDVANKAYEAKLLFAGGSVPKEMGHLIKRYPDGMMWINAGARCSLIGSDMKNCGSSGLMSTDPDKTIVALYDKNRVGHALFTLSPNDSNRISGVQGVGSTELKPQYNSYVLDVVKELGGWLDLYGSTPLNNELTLRYRLGDHLIALEKVGTSGYYTTYKLIVRLPNGNEETFYSNGYSVLAPSEIHSPQYAEYLKGNESHSDDSKAMTLLTLSSNGQMYYSKIQGIQAWMRSVGIVEPQQKR